MENNNEEPPRPEGIQINTIAPLIDTIDIYENPINLIDLLKDNSGVLIDFFRGNWWSHCKKHLKLLTEHIHEFENRKIKLIAIASDSIRLLRKFKEENEFNVNIISDRGAVIAKKYDVYWFAPGAGVDYKIKQAVPSKFLINKDRKIIWKYIGKDKTDRPSIEMMTEIIDKKIINPNYEWIEYKKNEMLDDDLVKVLGFHLFILILIFIVICLKKKI